MTVFELIKIYWPSRDQYWQYFRYRPNYQWCKASTLMYCQYGITILTIDRKIEYMFTDGKR